MKELKRRLREVEEVAYVDAKIGHNQFHVRSALCQCCCRQFEGGGVAVVGIGEEACLQIKVWEGNCKLGKFNVA